VFSALLLTGAVSAPSPAGAEVIRRVAAGSEALGAQLAVSGNGRFLIRREETGGVCNTAPVPTVTDIAVYDLEALTAECVNVDPAGAGVFGFHSSASISADGQLVAFSSSANGLDPRCSGNNSIPHIFLRNRMTRRTECISITEAGDPGNAASFGPAISASGNLIAFWSLAWNLTPGKIDNAGDVVIVRVVAGRRSGAISRLARPSTADQTLVVSADGRFVMFPSSRPGPVGGVTLPDLFRHDLETGETIPIGVSAAGEPANALVISPSTLSADGRFATFTSNSTNLVPGVTSPIRQLYRRDLQTGDVLLVSRSMTGVPGNSEAFLFSALNMSADGRFVVFASAATNLVANDTNGRADVFVADLSTGASRITRLSVAADGVTEGNEDSQVGASISADAGIVAFASHASNLDPESPGSGAFLARIPALFENGVLTGAGLGGGPHVRSLASTGAVDPAKTFFAYDATFGGGVTVAQGDLDGDGVPEVITGAGPGDPPLVRVFSGARSTHGGDGYVRPIELASFYAYDARFRGGVAVAVADVTGDGIGDIITGAGPGAGPHVRVFQASAASTSGPMSISEYASFFAYDPAFRGGVRVGAGDLDGNGVSEILTAAGPGASPHVQAFVLNAARQLETVLSFYAYHPAFTGGVFVAAGDVDGDGREELITGADAGGSPHVRVFGTGPAFSALREVHSFFAYERGFTGGVRVAAGDLDGDGAAEIITAPGPWHTPLVRVYHTYDNGALGEMSSFYAYDPGFSGGVFVAEPR
jgi:Tol biopolymer transport system component